MFILRIFYKNNQMRITYLQSDCGIKDENYTIYNWL